MKLPHDFHRFQNAEPKYAELEECPVCGYDICPYCKKHTACDNEDVMKFHPTEDEECFICDHYQ